MSYTKRLNDAYDDPFKITADDDGEIYMTGVDEDGMTVANLSFDPEGALKTARALTKAAMVAQRIRDESMACPLGLC